MYKKRNKAKKYTQAEISIAFNLQRLNTNTTVMNHWHNTTCVLSDFEKATFQNIISRAVEDIDTWNEEDLKMNFIAFVLQLSHLQSTRNIRTFFEKTIEAEVDGIHLKTKTDFMIAKGVLDIAERPYFHFQEYKRETDPYGDPLGQLLEAFLIAQEINKNGKPIYGAYIVGRYWHFVTMEGREYCVSKSFDSTQEDDLLSIIAILRHFKVILETVLINN